MDRNIFITDLETFWPGYKLLVSAGRPSHLRSTNQSVGNGGESFVATAYQRSIRASGTVPITGLLASFKQREAGDVLAISCTTEDQERFTLLIPESQLPVTDSATRANFGVERSSAAELLVWLEETTFRYTAAELDGRFFSDL